MLKLKKLLCAMTLMSVCISPISMYMAQSSRLVCPAAEISVYEASGVTDAPSDGVTVTEAVVEEQQIQPLEESYVTECEEPETITYAVPLDTVEQFQIIGICVDRGYDPALLLAIAMKETVCDASAIGDNGQSYGMYQIQPKWWRTDKDLFNAVEATEACCDILDYLYFRYGSTERVLNAYNTGNPDKYNGYSADVLRIYNEIAINE